MSDLLYNRALLRLAADAVGAGHLDRPSAVGTAFNPACGDRVTVELRLEEGRIAAIAHGVKACLFAQASASILGMAAHGSVQSDIESLKRAVTAMLHGISHPPGAPFESYAAFKDAIDLANRHRCVMLPIEATLAAFANDEAPKLG